MKPLNVAVSMVGLSSERMTGVERASIEFINAVQELGLPDLRLTVFAPLWARDWLEVVDASPPTWLPRPAALEAWQLLACRRHHVDVLHMTFGTGPRAGRARQVVTVYDTVAWQSGDTISKGNRYYFRPALDSAFRNGRVAALVTSATHTLEFMRTHLAYSGLSAVVPLGLSEPFRSVDLGVQHARSGQPLRVLTVGTLEPRKGLDVIAQAARSLRDEQVEVDWRLVGRRGWYREEVPGVTLVGAIADSELLREYLEADVIVAPSFDEGFDLPVLEALACGRPVLATDIPAHREHFGEVVELFAPGDAAWVANRLRQFASGAATLPCDSRLRSRFARGFTWHRAAIQVVELWRAASDSS